MGVNSTIKVKCIVTFSVTNATYSRVYNEIRNSGFDKIIEKETDGAVTVLSSIWQGNQNNIGAWVGMIAFGPVGWTYPSMVYEMSVDTYKLIKDNSNRLVAQMSKAFKESRNNMIIKKLKEQVEKGFNDKLSEGTFTHFAVTLKSVKVEKI